MICISTVDNANSLSVNAKLILEASDLNLSVGDPVDLWTDKSATSNPVSQTGSFRPTMKIDAQGFKCVHFENQKMLTQNNYVYTDDETVIIVATVFNNGLGDPNSRQKLLSGAFGFPFYQYDVDVFSGSIDWAVTNVSGGSGRSITEVGNLTGVKCVFTFVRNYDNVYLYKNKTLVSTMPLLSHILPAPLKLLLGSDTSYIDIYSVYQYTETFSKEKVIKMIKHAAVKSGVKM